MLKDEKILVTGASGQVASTIAEFLAQNNQVWGAARLADSEKVDRMKASGIRPAPVDLGSGDFSQLPDDFTYLLHFGFTRGGIDEFDRALRVNAEGTGLIMQHCRKAKAALVVSSAAIYAPNDNPKFVQKEAGEIGRSYAPWSPTSPVSKIAEESVARFCARAFDLPTTIVRLNTVYGRPPHLPSMHIRSILAGQAVTVPSDPNFHSPIHIDDMCDQIEPLLDAAAVPAQIINWAGDEVVSAQQWCAMAGQLSGREVKIEVKPLPGAPLGNIADVSRRNAVTGPCKVKFEDGFRRLYEAFHAPSANA
jgi:nucleoside-diphosphate-sugar epimerase